MKKAVLSLAAVIAAFASLGMTDTERIHLRNLAQRPRCESRRLVVVGGTTNVVETWRRGGYSWTQTNAVRRVVGRVQTNTFEQRLAEARAQAEELREKWQTALERATTAEAKAARAEAVKAWLVEQRDKSQGLAAKAIYQAILNKFED